MTVNCMDFSCTCLREIECFTWVDKRTIESKLFDFYNMLSQYIQHEIACGRISMLVNEISI